MKDLYGLQKVCQKALDLVLTCPDAKLIIQTTTDSGMKARFQHIRDALVLGFEVDTYTDINTADFPFSLDDLQYLWYHFEVFLAVTLFGLTANEKESLVLLDAYLNTRDVRIAYQEQTRKALQEQNQVPMSSEPEVDIQNKMSPMDIPRECILVAAETSQADNAHE